MLVLCGEALLGVENHLRHADIVEARERDRDERRAALFEPSGRLFGEAS